jgi:hypothetical protein
MAGAARWHDGCCLAVVTVTAPAAPVPGEVVRLGRHIMRADRRRELVRSTSHSRRRIAAVAVIAASLFVPGDAEASLLSPELEDKLATFLALFVIFVVPVVLIVLFWMVHVLPEKIAHKRHHPQYEAIRTLCLLSLVFGGLLWPFAWLWAYSKPVLYKAAYGTDKHPDALTADHGAAAAAPVSLHDRVAQLEDRVPEAELAPLRADLEALEAKFIGQEVR